MMTVAPIRLDQRSARFDSAAWSLRTRSSRLGGLPGDLGIPARTDAEIARIAAAGEIVGAALQAAISAAVIGATTAEMDAAAREVILASGAESLFLDYPSYSPGEGYPGWTCVSVNEQVVHGIPGRRRLDEGDIVTIDCGVRLDGWCADAARTIEIGRVRPTISRMIRTADSILDASVDMIRPGLAWSSVAHRMQRTAEEAGFGVVREYVGHGVGRSLHEPPQAPAFVSPAFLREADFTIHPGMVLAIEPMLTLGDPATGVLNDGWTVVTLDGEPACHVENTVAVTQSGAVVLTDGESVSRCALAEVLQA